MIKFLNSSLLFILLLIFSSYSLHSQAWIWSELGQDINVPNAKVSLNSDGSRVVIKHTDTLEV